MSVATDWIRDGDDIAEVLRRAIAGDRNAWDSLVERYSPMVWAIARGMGRTPSEARDVSQATWLRLVEHASSIQQPERVGAWLATTARRECLRQCQKSWRQTLISDEDEFDVIDLRSEAPDTGVIEDERDVLLWKAFAQLPQRERTLLTLLTAEPRLSYQEISSVMEMPIGSIGPTRGRCLTKLRELLLVDPTWEAP